MPVYKESLGHLEKSIQGVLGQRYRDFEYVIAAEPNEENIALLEDIEKTDSRMKVIRNKVRLGVAETRNTAIRECSGEYVAFVDADDISHPDRFEKQLRFLEENPDISVVGSNMLLVDEHDNVFGERKYPETHEEVRKAFLLTMPLANPTVMVRHNDLKELGIFDSKLVKSEDFELWMRFLANGRRFYNLQDKLISYRIPAGHNEKRPVIHWVNNYVVRKNFSKSIWPFHQRIVSQSAYFLISRVPEVFLDTLLSLSLVNQIKGIKRY